MIAYLLTYNTPNQLRISLAKNHQLFANLTKIYIIDNSDDDTIIKENIAICQNAIANSLPIQFIHQGQNIGIGPARILASQHFISDTRQPYMMYLEDDFLVNPEGFIDKCSFRNNLNPADIPRFTLKTMETLQLDYLKLSFQEIFGNNNQNWGYYNMDSDQKKQYDSQSLHPEHKIYTPIHHIVFIDGTPIATGNIYYSNWPQVTSRKFCEKFLLKQPDLHEQRITAAYSLLLSSFKSATLIGSAFTHYRTEIYKAGSRKET